MNTPAHASSAGTGSGAVSAPAYWAVRLVYWLSSALTLALGLGAVVVVGGVLTDRWQASAVLTGSMDPALPARSLILAQPTPTLELERGQVLMFTAPTQNQEQVVHRIVSVSKDKDTSVVTVQTKGDANPIKDPWVAQVTDETSWVVRHHVPFAGLAVTDPLVSGAVFLALLLMVYGSSVVLGEWQREPEDETSDSDNGAA